MINNMQFRNNEEAILIGKEYRVCNKMPFLAMVVGTVVLVCLSHRGIIRKVDTIM